MAAFRYLVHDADAAVAFYTGPPGFALKQQFGPSMAILTRDDCRRGSRDRRPRRRAQCRMDASRSRAGGTGASFRSPISRIWWRGFAPMARSSATTPRTGPAGGKFCARIRQAM